MLEASKLMILTKGSDDPINGYTDCFSFILCRNQNPACFLGSCQKCGNFLRFEEHVSSVLYENKVEELIFSVWQSTDKCTLKRECLSVDDFTSELSLSLKKLIPHHFIAKN